MSYIFFHKTVVGVPNIVKQFSHYINILFSKDILFITKSYKNVLKLVEINKTGQMKTKKNKKKTGWLQKNGNKKNTIKFIKILILQLLNYIFLI